MASTFQMPVYYRPSALTVDTAHAQQKFFDEEDEGVLDDSIIDQSAIDSGLDMSPALADSRRESFAIGSSLFSPKQEDWPSVDLQSLPTNNPFMSQQPQNANPFLQAQHQSFMPQQQNWVTMANSTPASTVTAATFDGLPVEFDSNPGSGFLRSPIPFSNPTNNVAMFSSVNNHSSSPASPQKEHWSGNMGMNKKSRPDSPGIRSHNELRKGDGVRKKNARFDIPAERNLANIDQLISQSTDEQEVKELKQQKRLLRNRQAALDSRQRKKQHTEQLEVEKKHYTAVISNLEEELEDLRLTLQQMHTERSQMMARMQALEFDNEELVRRNIEETGELRRQVKCLRTHIQDLEGSETSPSSGMSSMGAATSSFPGTFEGDLDGINVENNWDHMGYMGDFQSTSIDQAVVPEMKQEMTPRKAQASQLVVSRRSDSNTHTETEKPTTQGGVLFMLFLVGALVCSSRSMPSIPRVSEDVRAASETILHNVIKDAGISEPTTSSFAMPSLPQPSGSLSWPESSAPAVSATGLDGVVPSMLGDLSDFLTQPTAEQTKEHLFSMTAAQYDGMMSDGFLHTSVPEDGERSTSQGRRNLAEALASATQSNKAEVYTRSLLWDQIPRDVVKTFVKMVAECNQNACQPVGNDNDAHE
ncbi:hypothetical protein PpBr36_00389 [Pyricularia pennisetigena]|uniref:hypothetical protein n=1 Tax=Pyricularia pennisetigena TaxID=1578925 RepID=UPI0011516C61|nr:hypothetical protein PpBr36_00389 [Pyricularia pennisetigena]TLS28563.1 hypothetical protein PpBr36_00389 [Pyricularia pennisetigena]